MGPLLWSGAFANGMSSLTKRARRSTCEASGRTSTMRTTGDERSGSEYYSFLADTTSLAFLAPLRIALWRVRCMYVVSSLAMI